jgi:hypothetical protein
MGKDGKRTQILIAGEGELVVKKIRFDSYRGQECPRYGY